MSASIGNFSDDFFINVDLHTSLPLPQGRETVLQFCEAVQKQFPDLSDFYQRDGGEFVLEGDRMAGAYRWLELQTKRLSSGAYNPSDAEAAYAQHTWLLERSRYFLGVTPLDVESLDLVYGFNLDFTGNRDAIVGEALLSGSRLGAIVSETGALALNVEPNIVIAMDPECSLQVRLSIETHNSSFQVRTGHYDEEPISVYLAVRAYPHPQQRLEPAASLRRQAEVGEDLIDRVVIPKVVRPIASAIATAQ